MHEFGALIKEARERRRIRAYDLAYAIEQSPSWVSKLENGDLTHPPSPVVMQGLARELGLDQGAMLESLGYQVSPPADEVDPLTNVTFSEFRDLTPEDLDALRVIARRLRDRSR